MFHPDEINVNLKDIYKTNVIKRRTIDIILITTHNIKNFYAISNLIIYHTEKLHFHIKEMQWKLYLIKLSLYWAIAYAREKDADLLIDDMTDQLEAMCEVVMAGLVTMNS